LRFKFFSCLAKCLEVFARARGIKPLVSLGFHEGLSAEFSSAVYKPRPVP
jgi:hypothetical protein